MFFNEELGAIQTRLCALEAERSKSTQSLFDKLRNAEVRIEHLEDVKDKLTEQVLQLQGERAIGQTLHNARRQEQTEEIAPIKKSFKESEEAVPGHLRPSTPPPPETAPPPGVVTEPPPPPSSTKPNVEASAVPVAQTSYPVASGLPVKAPPQLGPVRSDLNVQPKSNTGPMPQPPSVQESTWDCPKCGETNSAKRSKCNVCEQIRADAKVGPASLMGKAPPASWTAAKPLPKSSEALGAAQTLAFAHLPMKPPPPSNQLAGRAPASCQASLPVKAPPKMRHGLPVRSPPGVFS